MNHKETIVFCIVHLFGSLLPIIIAILYYLATNQWSGWNVFYQEGQFFIYSAALLTASAYIFYTFKIKNSDFHSILFWFSSFLIVFASLFYSFNIAGIFENLPFKKYSSIAFFGITLLIYYKANYTNQKRTDVIGEDHDNTRRLMNRL
ncbi:MAG: hypothetical protein FVQ77_00560 [Cytophagales bacterium]|nr:hypothetical protein [Cytophagales bacterium]